MVHAGRYKRGKLSAAKLDGIGYQRNHAEGRAATLQCGFQRRRAPIGDNMTRPAGPPRRFRPHESPHGHTRGVQCICDCSPHLPGRTENGDRAMISHAVR